MDEPLAVAVSFVKNELMLLDAMLRDQPYGAAPLRLRYILAVRAVLMNSGSELIDVPIALQRTARRLGFKFEITNPDADMDWVAWSRSGAELSLYNAFQAGKRAVQSI